MKDYPNVTVTVEVSVDGIPGAKYTVTEDRMLLNLFPGRENCARHMLRLVAKEFTQAVRDAYARAGLSETTNG